MRHEADEIVLHRGDGRAFGSPEPLGQVEATRLACTDVNGDGLVDVIRGNSTALGLMLNDGNGRFSTTPTIAFSGTTQLATADLDGDGRGDLVALDGDVLNTYRGTVEGLTAVASSPCPPGRAFVLAEVDGDERPDAVTWTADEISFHRGDGTGGFAEASATRVVDRPELIHLSASDLDSGGVAELVSFHGRGGGDAVGLVWRLGAQDTFIVARAFALVGPVSAASSGDMNDDGVQDLAVVLRPDGPSGTAVQEVLLLLSYP